MSNLVPLAMLIPVHSDLTFDDIEAQAKVDILASAKRACGHDVWWPPDEVTMCESGTYSDGVSEHDAGAEGLNLWYIEYQVPEEWRTEALAARGA